MPNPPKFTSAHHLARLPDHSECRERVGHAEHQTGPALPLDKIDGIGKAGRQWLIADHINALVEKRDTGLIVGGVRRSDRDCVDPVRPCRLACRHLLKIAVDAVGRQHPLSAGGFGHNRVGGQRPGDYVPAVGEFGPVGMNPADIASSAAYDAKSQPAPSGGEEGSRGHDGRPSTACVIASAPINIVPLQSFARKMSFASRMGSCTALNRGHGRDYPIGLAMIFLTRRQCPTGDSIEELGAGERDCKPDPVACLHVDRARGAAAHFVASEREHDLLLSADHSV